MNYKYELFSYVPKGTTAGGVGGGKPTGGGGGGGGFSQPLTIDETWNVVYEVGSSMRKTKDSTYRRSFTMSSGTNTLGQLEEAMLGEVLSSEIDWLISDSPTLLYPGARLK